MIAITKESNSVVKIAKDTKSIFITNGKNVMVGSYRHDTDLVQIIANEKSYIYTMDDITDINGSAPPVDVYDAYKAIAQLFEAA